MKSFFFAGATMNLVRQIVWGVVYVFLLMVQRTEAAEPEINLPPGVIVEAQPTDASQAKIVLIAGSTFFRPGEHEYIANCAVLADLLRQTPGVFPVLAVDWPKQPETLKGAKAVVLFFDGGDKHGVLNENRLVELQKLIDGGVGLTQFHQTIDYPVAHGERARSWAGGTWEKGFSERAHWISEFKSFPTHPICSGVAPFQIDDGWLTKLRFVDGMKGITPLLRTASPKSARGTELRTEAIVAWTYDRPARGRTFNFTGGHLHRSFLEEGYRRFLVNGILWSAGLEIPKDGAPVALISTDLEKYRVPRATAKK